MSIEQKLQGLFEADIWELEKEKKRLQETHDGLPKIIKELVEMTGIEESQLLRLAVWTARNEHPAKWYEVLSILHTFHVCKRTTEKEG